MNKQELLEFIQSLPDNLEVSPISTYDSRQEKIGDNNFIGLMGSTYRAQYEQTYLNDLTLNLHFVSQIRYEYQRDDRGVHFANSRMVN